MCDRLSEICGGVFGNFMYKPMDDNVVYESQVMIERLLEELRVGKELDFDYKINVNRWVEDGIVYRALYIKILDDYGIGVRALFDPCTNMIDVKRIE